MGSGVIPRLYLRAPISRIDATMRARAVVVIPAALVACAAASYLTDSESGITARRLYTPSYCRRPLPVPQSLGLKIVSLRRSNAHAVPAIIQGPPRAAHHVQRRGMSFDANATLGHHREAPEPNETTSARGNFALPCNAFPDVADLENVPMRRRQEALSPATAEVGGPSGHGITGGQEQLIPAYVPVQQGSFSKATHRRSSSRSGTGGAVDAGGGEGGSSAVGSGGIIGAVGANGAARSNSPPESPFFAARSPPKVLPPVPAFVDDLKQPPVSPPPPPSVSEGKAYATETIAFDYAFLPAAANSLPGNSSDAGDAEQVEHGGRAEGAGGMRDLRRDGASQVGMQ